MSSGKTIFRHGDYEMRSHSETCVADAMDQLGVTWLYEHQRVDTRHGWYVPDFYLPMANLFIEVKGAPPTREEIDKAMDAQAETGSPVLFAHGRPKMEMASVHGGRYSYFTDKGEVGWSSFEVSKLVRLGMSMSTYAAFIRAAEHKPKPDGTMIGELLDERLRDWMGRPDYEDCLRRQHGELNAEKETIVRQSSKSEWFLAQVSAKLSASA
jgi:hypothetical protein